MLMHATLVGFPNGNNLKDWIMQLRAVVLAALILNSVACTIADGNKSGAPTDLTGIPTTSHPDTGISATTTPTAAVPVSIATGNFPGLSGLAVISDDFTEYAGTPQLMARITLNNPGGTGPAHGSFYGDGINASLASIDPSVLYNGHQTLKLSQPGGVANTPWLAVGLPTPLTHIWYRAKIRFSPGWTTTGTLSNSANAYKMLSWGWSGADGDGSGRLEISNTAQYELYENVQTGPSLIGGGNYLEAGSISTEWTDGAWYDYIIEIDHTQPIGVIRLWRSKAGQPPVFIGETQEKMNNGSPMPALTGISVGLNFNQVRAPNQSQAVWWGEWEVVDGTQHSNPFGVSR